MKYYKYKSPLEAVQGMLVWVYDCSLGNSSNGGLSSYCQRLEIGKDIELVKGNLGSCIARPIKKPPEGHIGWMSGGCYISTHDSRFSEAVEHILGHRFYGAIPLHDRSETQEMYDRMWH